MEINFTVLWSLVPSNFLPVHANLLVFFSHRRIRDGLAH